MNILLTGNLSSLAATFARELTKQRHRVILASKDTDRLDLKLSNTIVHSIHPVRDNFVDAMSSYGFDIIIFISSREEQLNKSDDITTGYQLDELRNALELAKRHTLRHFFYISSTEVYGDMEERCENKEPLPASLNGYTLLAGERYCEFYKHQFGLNLTILRVPYVYGPDERTGFLYTLMNECRNQDGVFLPGDAYRLSSFLHIDDVLDFLKRAIDEEYTLPHPVVNLSSHAITNLSLSELIIKYFPHVVIHFDEEKRAFTGPAEVLTAKNVFDWVDLHDLNSEFADYSDSMHAKSLPKTTSLSGFFRKLPHSTEILKPIELVLGAVVTQILSQLTGTLIQYKYVDFRLLFVVIMGSVYGLRYGLLAAFFVNLSLIYTWYKLEIDWSLLIYNVGNWFPLILYFVTGLIIGYSHDRTETLLYNEKEQTKLIYEKYHFLYEVFNEIRKLKDEFREQVIGYRDSFGKIYTITRELDTLQEQDVYFKALSILEELMDNNSIAIYCLEPDQKYARLEVSSTSLSNKLAKSLKLSTYPEAVKSIEQGTIFQNTALLPNYPAYIAPIFNNSYPFNVPVAIIVIWSVKFEGYSTYYYNLFKVICGLIQASLLRATKFLEANYEKMYIPATRILSPDAFNDVLKTRAEMSKNKIAVDQIIRVENIGINFEDLYSKVSRCIRTVDIVGMRADGNCYILLSQADYLAAKEVIARLEKKGLPSKLINSEEIVADDLQLVA